MLQLPLMIDAAKRAANIRSDRSLCAALGLSAIAVHHYRYNAVLPSDETMVRLCALSGLDPTAGLIALNISRSEGEARARYRALAEALEVDLRPFLGPTCRRRQAPPGA